MERLLNHIIDCIGVEYISDLRDENLRTTVLSCLEDIQDDNFTVKQWNDSLNYIFNIQCSFQNVSQAKNF